MSLTIQPVSAAVSKLFEKILFPNKCLEPRLDAKSGMYGVAPVFPLELLQQFFSFASSMGMPFRRMTPPLNMPGHLRRMASRWPSDYIFFSKLKEHLSGTEFSSDSDVKTAAENYINDQERDFYQAGLTSWF
ncbi:hypothetical protein AVEN_12906-1 [Araneus ventricosus]|uniref:Uncharacterized protein n=1 Tax=Araneus ventricosus TaxID=182803 RepID=A0A4Y2N958_ARAVE|nr:hypothetical protein AVEN_12906-1 [Araneus ventricosus]